MIPKMWLNAHNESFDSIRFSKNDEIFCYLKTEGNPNSDMEKRSTETGEIEDNLEHFLRKKNIGCIVGAGTGIKYSYIEMQ
ncbi:MAG: hypothetical protein KGD63_01345 [Candidatus Lokiarchaeota archaeon]|nr:hypothetical protein [Candidatus Lokiarchaeota archaeon]